MHLKELEIHGFKSFADRTGLTFLPGVTAIVGPNGSGKSNIADGLRWVMGEHNIRNLRGAKLDDIIFSGSETRKPLGMAEVTLVLENADGVLPLDFTEVAVTRRIYRSGESEFLLNRTPVRLKDIQELFFDTGLGKESYSIIGQGKIDSILSLRPEERRVVFEEAAGITKYKHKKSTALRKLVETENNLLRVQDVLEELKNQMEPLSRRAEEARAYLAIRDELEMLEINSCRQELNKIALELENLAGNELKFNQRLKDIEEEGRHLGAKAQELKSRLEQLEEEKSTTQRRLFERSTEKERALGELHLLAERRRFQNERLVELETLLQEQETKLSRLEEKRKDLAGQVEMSDEEKERLSRAVQEGEEQLRRKESRIEEIRRRLEEKKDNFAVALKNLSSLKQEINGMEVYNTFRREKMAEYRETLEGLACELAENEQTGSLLQVKSNETQQHLDELAKEEESLRMELGKIQVYLDKQAERNQEFRERIRAVESRITVYSAMEKEYYGYNQGVKSLLKAKKETFSREIHGVVADLIKVEKGYELALETALGGSLQYVVINEDRAARKAIDYLKKHSLGRVTFLPLNLIELTPDRFQGWQNLFNQYGCRPATSVLRFNPCYQPVVFHLLGGTIIAPELKTAVLVAEKTGKRYRLVTPEGEVVSPGGAITGGKLKQQQVGLLARKRALSELNAEKNDLLAFLNQGLAEEKRLQEKAAAVTTALEEKKNQYQEMVVQKNSLQKDREVLEKTRRRIQEQQKQVNQAAAGLEAEIAAQTDAVGEMTATLQRLEEETERENKELKRLEEQETELLNSKETGLREHSALTARLAGIQQEWAGKRASLQELENSLQELAATREEKKKELLRIKDELLQQDRHKITLETRARKDEEERESIENKLEAVTREWHETAAELAGTEERTRELQHRRGEITAELHRLELQVNKLRLQKENLHAYMSEIYGEEWTGRVQDDWTPPPGVKQIIARRKKQLKEMEPVNIQAIEDYEQMSERVSFLSRQYDDLTAARTTLEQVIREIEKTIQVRFVETFRQVRGAFTQLFEQLFSGGQADLKLLEPENPLESGIEILAQPPGKRLQILSLLSGGERAMTAIALLFAVLRVKPSPFCILDEIDATLDHVNIKRFVELLKLFSREIQFIMITHRRDTMEVAEALYGVTMEEKGVSKLISLDLKRRAG